MTDQNASKTDLQTPTEVPYSLPLVGERTNDYTLARTLVGELGFPPADERLLVANCPGATTLELCDELRDVTIGRAWTPRHRKTIRVGPLRRKRVIEVPMMPGLVFCSTIILHTGYPLRGASWLRALGTLEARYAECNGSEIWPMLEEALRIDAPFRSRGEPLPEPESIPEQPTGLGQNPDDDFIPDVGSWVRLRKGLLEGLTGIVIEVTRSGAKVKADSAEWPFTVPFHNLEPAAAPARAA